jgi:hypothetical protein
VTDPAPLPIATPPGWYPEPGTRRYRWWDGIQWAFYPPEGQEAGATVAVGAVGPTPTNPYSGVGYPTSYQHPKNSMATASLVLGLVGLVTCTLFIPSILAVIFGIVGVQRAGQLGGVGRGKAIWGLSLGGFVLVVVLLYVTGGTFS